MQTKDPKNQLNRTALKDPDLVGALRAAVTGRVITPEHADYDKARTIFYGGFDSRPAAIVYPQSAQEVARVVTLARESGVELAVRSGGHSSAGHSATQGGVLLDLSDLRRLSLDPENRTAWAESGLTAGEYTQAASAHGLATGFGDTGSVGLGGLTLGGGIGYLVRKYGLTIDNLLAAEIVTADGQILHIDADHHPDLFWAIRGGGGNFGVVTRFQYRLHPVDQILGGMLILPATPEVIAGFMRAALAAPDELSTIANVMTAPPMPLVPPELHGQIILLAMMAYAGDLAQAEQALAPFRSLAAPIADLVRPIRYPEMFPPEGEDYHPTAASRTLFMDRIGLEEAGKILHELHESDAVFRVAQLRALGGAMARVPVEATAFAHRQSPFMVNLAAFYTTPEDRQVREAWVADFEAALRQEDHGRYVNFMGTEGAGLIAEAYPPATLRRLAEIKARYDPDNLFRLNQNILPAR